MSSPRLGASVIRLQHRPVLETAINGRAEILVTVNLRHFEAAKGMFEVVILSPADALEWLRKRP